MPLYEYSCSKCGEFDVAKPMKDSEKNEKCPECGVVGTRIFRCAISGTKDSFGIKNAFKTDDGKEISTWKQWEKAGYAHLKDTPMNVNTKAKALEKQDKIRVANKDKISIGTI